MCNSPVLSRSKVCVFKKFLCRACVPYFTCHVSLKLNYKPSAHGGGSKGSCTSNWGFLEVQHWFQELGPLDSWVPQIKEGNETGSLPRQYVLEARARNSVWTLPRSSWLGYTWDPELGLIITVWWPTIRGAQAGLWQMGRMIFLKEQRLILR